MNQPFDEQREMPMTCKPVKYGFIMKEAEEHNNLRIAYNGQGKYKEVIESCQAFIRLALPQCAIR